MWDSSEFLWKPNFECMCKVTSPERHGLLLIEETRLPVLLFRYIHLCCFFGKKKIAGAYITPGVCMYIQEVREQRALLHIHVPLYRPWAQKQALIKRSRDCFLLLTIWRSTEWFLAFANRKIRAETCFEIVNNVFAPESCNKSQRGRNFMQCKGWCTLGICYPGKIQ